MPRHSARRFLLEVVFLAGVAAALTYADLRPAAIIALMAIAWAVVALLEWTAWLDEPHYGRGLPARYYVPHVALPPPVAVEQGEPAYPVLVDDDPTFVASTQEWGIDVAEWPELEATEVAEDTVVRPLPPPIYELEQTVADDGLVAEEDTEKEAPVEVAGAAMIAAAVVSEPSARPEPAPSRPVVREPVELPMPERVSGTARHRVDPLVASRRRRLFSRGSDEGPTVEVRDGPPPDRTVPSRVLEESSRR